MEVLKVNQGNLYLKEIEKLYLNSFPSYERIEFKEILDKKFPNSQLYALLENEDLIGMTYLSQYKEFLYVIYLAIEEKIQNKGYGSNALEKISKKYKDKTMVLCVEKPIKEECVESRRIQFYTKNGFSIANIEFECLGQSYYVMHKGDLDIDNFIEFLLICFPESKNFKNRISYN